MLEEITSIECHLHLRLLLFLTQAGKSDGITPAWALAKDIERKLKR